MRSAPAAPAALSELEICIARLLRAGESFPPCDILWTAEDRLRIALAVAGFGVDDLSVCVIGDQLIVRGRRQPDRVPRQYMHRGIATRRFQRTFLLAAGMRVEAARLENGLLNIELLNTGQPGAQSIPIGRPGDAA